MRVHADLDLCQGHAVCAMEAPQVFAADDHVRILDDHPAGPALDAARKAVTYCPTLALTLTED